MVKIFFLVLFILQCTSAQLLEDPKQHKLLLRGIHQTLKQEYDSAEITFRTIIAHYPKHPCGYLYLAGMLQARFSDYGDRFNSAQYDSLLTVASELAEEMLKSKSTEAWGWYYSGVADAFRSYTASDKGNLPTGFFYGISAGSALEKCLEVDSSFLAAKNILGSYYYWRSKLAWIPFLSDRTEEGIRLVKQAFFHPYEKHLASHNLMLIFIDEGRYEEAEYYGILMLNEYPSNRSYLWNMMTVYEKWRKPDSVKSVVNRLLHSTLNAKVTNRYTEATCRLKLAQFALRERRYEDAKSECRSIISLKKYIGKTKGDLKSKIKQAEMMLEKIASSTMQSPLK